MSSVTTNALRASLRRAASCSRHSSTQAASSPPSSSSSPTPSKLDVKPKAELPADKMRILVDLYHQSDLFVTKANLSSKIDEAFVHRPQREPLGTALSPEQGFRWLEIELQRRRMLPKFRQGPHTNMKRLSSRRRPDDTLWSEWRDEREVEVMRALYGVYYSGRPGYDALMDEEEASKEQEGKEEGEGEGSS